jgi:hypothetical protein
VSGGAFKIKFTIKAFIYIFMRVFACAGDEINNHRGQLAGSCGLLPNRLAKVV